MGNSSDHYALNVYIPYQPIQLALFVNNQRYSHTSDDYLTRRDVSITQLNKPTPHINDNPKKVGQQQSCAAYHLYITSLADETGSVTM